MLGRLSFFSALGLGSGRHGRFLREGSVGWGSQVAAGELSAGASQGGDGEDYRVQLLKIPELGEVKPDRAWGRAGRPASTCWTSQARPLFTAASASGPASSRTSTARAVSSMLDGVPAAPPQPPSAFWTDSSQATPRRAGSVVHHIEVAVSGQHAGGAVGRILVVGGVLVAEPQRQPGAVGALRARAEVGEAARRLHGRLGTKRSSGSSASGLSRATRSIRSPCQAASARRTWAVRSAPLRSNGRWPQPRQKVGQPPSRFCKPEQPAQTPVA